MAATANLLCPSCPSGVLARIEMADATQEYVQNLPNKSAYEIGYDLGFATEKVLEIAITKRVATSFKPYPNAKGFGFDFNFIRFDAHKFRLGGRKTDFDVWGPHIDIPSKGIKHWPWHQVDKWHRGVK